MVINCKKPCKKKRSTMLTVEQMVDIALGTPEIGAVNFNVLHALIHVIIQQLNIQKCLVEFKGYESERMEGIILSAKPGPILKLSEYMIDVNDGKTYSSGKEKPSRQQGKDEEKNKEEGKESSGMRPPCECTGKKRKTVGDDEREKSDRGKDDPDTEVKDKKKVLKKELTPEECEEVEEPEPKKIREVKKPKSCPCKDSSAGGKDESEIQGVDESLKAVPSSYYGSDSEGACQTIVRVEPVGERCDSWRSRPALAHESMVKLEEKVAMLQDAFEALEQMPTNEELKKRAQSTGSVSTPVKDLWQLYNLNKRVESCEGTIEKLASMIEDIVKETCNYREAMMVIAGAVDEIECADQTGRKCCAALQGRNGGNTPVPQVGSTRSGLKFGETQTITFGDCDGKPCTETKEAESQAQPSKPSKAPAPPPSPKQNYSPSRVNINGEVEQTPPTEATKVSPQNTTTATVVASEPQDAAQPQGEQEPNKTVPDVVPLDVNVKAAALSELGGIGPEFYKMSAGEKFCVLKEFVDCLVCQIKNLTDNMPLTQISSKLCAIVSLQKQVDNLEKEWREFLNSFGAEGVTTLSKNLADIKLDIDHLDVLTSKITTDQRDISSKLGNVTEEASYLKKVKADLDVVEDLLAGKADASLLNRKVSHDQFDAACDDLTRGLDEALERLLQQEALWSEALDELQKGLDTKLDKVEIMPLKEFINKKLKCLQEKLKHLAQLRKDAEAAGAKSRIIRNLNCIACDANVVMKMDNKNSYQHSAMTASKNIRPMLTYELDQVRKAMKKGPCKGATPADEAIMDAQKKPIGIPLTQRDAVDSKVSKLTHLCNRYCGGSHTITTPQQRVTRIGHFLTEFGPQAMALFNQEFVDSKAIHDGVPTSMLEDQNTGLKQC